MILYNDMLYATSAYYISKMSRGQGVNINGDGNDSHKNSF